MFLFIGVCAICLFFVLTPIVHCKGRLADPPWWATDGAVFTVVTPLLVILIAGGTAMVAAYFWGTDHSVHGVAEYGEAGAVVVAAFVLRRWLVARGRKLLAAAEAAGLLSRVGPAQDIAAPVTPTR
ncbi:MAG: hypothetical protein H6982_14485 [Chromatiales bacterium]|nr:hypothetical protein [Chromatiales bacterium]